MTFEKASVSEIEEIKSMLSSIDGVSAPKVTTVLHVITTVGDDSARDRVYEAEREIVKRFPHLHFDFRVIVEPN